MATKLHSEQQLAKFYEKLSIEQTSTYQQITEQHQLYLKVGRGFHPTNEPKMWLSL